MNQKEKLIQAFIDDIDDHDFLSGMADILKKIFDGQKENQK